MAAAPFIIVGLGNPGAEYEQTRHNAGFWFLERLAGAIGFKTQKKLHAQTASVRIGGNDVLLCKPTTFMNRSGQSVRAVLDWYKLSITDNAAGLLVVHDELDLPPGVARLKFGGGHGGHNGLRSIQQHLGSNAYLRLRLGVGHPGMAEQVTGWLIHQRIPAADRAAVDAACANAESVLAHVISGEHERAMNHLHSLA
ncbi:MAG: aminoacyl-tRNA hydrolase [Gammaproteobacteria bacterium]|jgi:PTH1 family peptidyl-tRNA hydrolase|nr:aminoacyl-tRNA hydrolase [Gammaproteobacteria bacterium]